jgi:hypothetical protein
MQDFHLEEPTNYDESDKEENISHLDKEDENQMFQEKLKKEEPQSQSKQEKKQLLKEQAEFLTGYEETLETFNATLDIMDS